MPPKKTKGVHGRPYPFQYAVKIVCTANVPGTSQTTPSLVPGVYTTVVNIHNPNDAKVRFRKKIALVGPDQVSEFLDGVLGPDEATRVDCREAAKSYGFTSIHGVEGFLVIESARSLDVVAVYTAGIRGGEVTGIDVLQIRERVLV